MAYKNIGYLFTGKRSAKGEEYWTGLIEWKGEKVRITVYKNKRKQTEIDSHPHLVIYATEEK